MFSSLSASRPPTPELLRGELVALRRYHGDADPGVLLRLVRQRLASSAACLEAKAFNEELADLRANLAILRLALDLERLRAETKANFNPDQPRDEDGQWTDEGGVAPDGTAIELVADRRRASWPVDLLDEEGDRGGHTIDKHVAKSDDALIQRLEVETYRTPFGTVYLPATGSFTSLRSANVLVNSTLSDNPALVSLVAGRRLGAVVVEKDFGSITGKEAYRSSSRSEPFIRETYGVRVLIFHDSSLARGYRVKTAFPIRGGRY
jgi:hypothetical protein